MHGITRKTPSSGSARLERDLHAGSRTRSDGRKTWSSSASIANDPELRPRGGRFRSDFFLRETAAKSESDRRISTSSPRSFSRRYQKVTMLSREPREPRPAEDAFARPLARERPSVVFVEILLGPTRATKGLGANGSIKDGLWAVEMNGVSARSTDMEVRRKLSLYSTLALVKETLDGRRDGPE